MKIISVTIMKSLYCNDMVRLRTNLPPAIPNVVKGSNLVMSFEVEKDKGEEYLKEHFELTEDVWNNIRRVDIS